MREIKFKAKRVDNGEWVYGDMVINTETDTYRIFSNFANVVHGDFTDDGLHYCSGQLDVVYPETVCQFTGLKDKNGVDIYEGDILKIDEGHPVEVRYEKIYASFGIWRKGWAFLHYFHEAVEPKDCEVIGNIHDKNKQKQVLIDMMRGDEEIGLYDDNPKNH